MDPVARAVSDVRRLRENADPFDRDSLADYLCRLAEEYGFKGIKNPRKGIARVLCVWKDGNNVYLAADASYGNEKEILGSILALSMFRPHVAVLFTASKPFWGIPEILETLRGVFTGPEVIIVDVKSGNVASIRGR